MVSQEEDQGKLHLLDAIKVADSARNCHSSSCRPRSLLPKLHLHQLPASQQMGLLTWKGQPCRGLCGACDPAAKTA